MHTGRTQESAGQLFRGDRPALLQPVVWFPYRHSTQMAGNRPLGVHEAGLPNGDYNGGEQIRVEERSQGGAGRGPCSEEPNAHLERSCPARMDAGLRGHSETIGQRMERDLEALLPLPEAPHDACGQRAGRVSSLSLVKQQAGKANCRHSVGRTRGNGGTQSPEGGVQRAGLERPSMTSGWMAGRPLSRRYRPSRIAERFANRTARQCGSADGPDQ